jgi:hypothetical protein
MTTRQNAGSSVQVRRPLPRIAARALQLFCVAWALGACSPAPVNNPEPRYPEKRRPPPLRSASDGEVMGANRQSIDDTLEGSPTNQHPAPGWEGEKGAAERAKDADCVPDGTPANTAGAVNAPEPGATPAPNGRPRSGKPCPKRTAP